MRVLRITLVVLGIGEIAFGIAFLIPSLMGTVLHLQPPAPRSYSINLRLTCTSMFSIGSRRRVAWFGTGWHPITPRPRRSRIGLR